MHRHWKDERGRHVGDDRNGERGRKGRKENIAAVWVDHHSNLYEKKCTSKKATKRGMTMWEMLHDFCGIQCTGIVFDSTMPRNTGETVRGAEAGNVKLELLKRASIWMCELRRVRCLTKPRDQTYHPQRPPCGPEPFRMQEKAQYLVKWARVRVVNAVYYETPRLTRFKEGEPTRMSVDLLPRLRVCELCRGRKLWPRSLVQEHLNAHGKRKLAH